MDGISCNLIEVPTNLKLMKNYFPICFVFFFFFFVAIKQSFASDSILVEKRVKKIKAFAEWLNSKPDCYIRKFDEDTVVCWKMYDTAISLFLDKKYLNPRYNIKPSIYTFDYFLRKCPIDSFILKPPTPLTDTLIKSGDYNTYFENTLIFYLPMYELVFEGFYFRFEPKNDHLIYIIEAGGPKEEYLSKKKFLNSL